MKRFFSVVTKCGHVGRGFFIPITFPVRAETAREAAQIARNIPRVKHHHKDAIQSVQEVTREEYAALKKQNASDPYLCCQNVQGQRALLDGIRDRIVEEQKEEKRIKKEKKNARYYRGKEAIRNVKNYLKTQPNCSRISIVRGDASVA